MSEKAVQMTKKQKRKFPGAEQICDIVIKAVFFFAFPAAWSAGFAGVKYLGERIHSGEPVEMSSFLAMLLALAAFTMVFGRFFCSRACAFGTYGDVLYAVFHWKKRGPGRPGSKQMIPDAAASKLRYVKYGILVLVCALCILGFSSQVAGSSPWTFFSQLVALKPKLGGTAGIVGLVLFVICSIGMAAEKRAFCRFLCPFGAVFSILPVLPFSMVQRKQKECIKGCRACANVCPARLDLPYSDIGGSTKAASADAAVAETAKYQFSMGECFGCSKCARICPKQNAGCATMKKGGKGIAWDIVKAVILAGLLTVAAGV